MESQPRAESGKTILVIGGTGVMGLPIVRQLRRAGWTVRAASRHAAQARDQVGPKAELVTCDAERVEELEPAMRGCAAVLICVSDLHDPFLEVRVTRNVVRLTPGLGVARLGLISGATVAEERRFFPMVEAKLEAEAALQASGVPWVILRLTWSMESLLRFVRGNRAIVMGHQSGTLHPIAGDDIGRMVARAFEVEEAAGHTFTIHGPVPYTMRQWLEAYCRLVAPGTHVTSTPLWVLSAMATLTRNSTLKAVIPMMKYFETHSEYGDPTEANRLLGAPTISLKQWAATRRTSREKRAA